MSGAISVKSRWTTPLSDTTASTRRRASRSPRFANVTRRSASGRRRLALASVVVMESCSNSELARLARISRSCAGSPPRRGPLVGVGILGSPWCVSGGRHGPPLSGGWSELLVLGQRTAVVGEVVVVVAVVVRDRARVEPGRAVLERQAHAD